MLLPETPWTNPNWIKHDVDDITGDNQQDGVPNWAPVNGAPIDAIVVNVSVFH